MDEDEARAWLAALPVSRETLRQIDRFAELLHGENERQNLVSASTLSCLYARHIVDSAQLVPLAPHAGSWADIGSGAGFPGLVCAIITGVPTTLIEIRAQRMRWLSDACRLLGLKNVTVEGRRAEAVTGLTADVVCARAVAPLQTLFALGTRLAHARTIWLLPKGKKAAAELASLNGAWQGEFVMQPSVTDPAAAIIVARHVRPAGRPPAIGRR